MAEVKDNAPEKRRQIDKSSRTMFAWVAGASALVGIALVIGGFLVQRIIFESKVLLEKSNTVSTLDSNIQTYDDLRNNIRALNTNAALGSARVNESERPLQVVLDALPADNNALALGASMQNLVGRVSGASLESFQITDEVQDESGGESTPADNSSGVQRIAFTMEISAANADTLRDVLRTIEHSIRVIDVDESTVEAGEEKITMSISGHAYYLPEKTIQLNKKEVTP